MSLRPLPFLLLALAAAPAIACTQAQSTAKMQRILGSPEYRQLVARTGEVEQPSAERSAVKSALGRFGGAVGGIGADVMTDQDAARGQRSAHESASRTKAVTTAVNDAGQAAGRGDHATACVLYDRVIRDLGIAPGDAARAP
ncbi:hypothetical protein [Piscinibacter sakaiensis]|uniref:Uncharacterized protein n=1 Tax=Piscinibacter sakaiensis TaxID=1547922 RepID=A0A0K8NY96_PISS1|nr:hypothetical protein [Piscinibacter sakaiensis]GAP35356.1 hypothetical protein ISF6_0962 [Piscinibacter sakaiensis]